MSAHTPGPWTYLPDEEHPRIVHADAVDVIYGGRDGELYFENGDADGRLIAAAPEMLEALEIVKEWPMPHDVWNKIVAAIAKAKGNAS